MIKCFECNDMARWYYVPCSDNWLEEERYLCDNCINRGCSCNLIHCSDNEPFDDEQFKDEQGRLLPCCEYDYSENGFEDDWLDVENYEGN